ncbi:ATP-dependent DNA ligase [Candidatus Bathyarchaeota archaeon]|nr:ATP-dependent DNA ligase [Candidatus Bathyarchaeota archaeon]
MDYAVLAEAYERIEATTKRLEMTDFLVSLLKCTPNELLDKVVYLTQGKLYPDFVGCEIGIAEKLAIKALIRASGRTESEIEEALNASGDLGETTQKFLSSKRQLTFFQEALTVSRVYEKLEKMANTSGSRALNLKTALLAGVLSDAKPKEAKYIIRTAIGNLRLGIADMSVLDALAIAYGGGKDSRNLIERAYTLSSDLGKVAKTVAKEGLEGLKSFKALPFRPIRPMLAERLSSSEEILEKLGGKCIAEYKYDGERIQAHKQGEKVILYSRRLENITIQYPDVVGLIKKNVRAKTAILEGECVATDPETRNLRSFQDLMRRRRKYEIEKAVSKIPVSLFMFDALYIDGKDLTLEPYPVRRSNLERIINTTERAKLAKQRKTCRVEELEAFFEEAIENGCEGLICKAIGPKSVYQAGARGWLWIKYKRDYKGGMNDTADFVVVGAFHGRGKRAGHYGAFLLASYNPTSDTFETITKCGTGFTDEDLEYLAKTLKKKLVSHKHPRVNSTLKADVWFEPSLVLEVLGAEVTISPIHTSAMNSVRKGSGLAIRFPRFTGNYRFDKAAEDATTSREVVEMYQRQLRGRKE